MIKLKRITWDNWEDCIALNVKKDQDDFIASNLYSLAQSYVALLNDFLPPMSFAIYNEDTMIGFTMIYHDSAEENEFGDEDCYGICRFMIDKKYQRKGLGKKALYEVIHFIKSRPQGYGDTVYLSYAPDNLAARRLYKSFGFEETGHIVDGEVVAKLCI